MIRESVIQAAQFIREADYLLVGTGAGMGVDSGLPDYRGNQGFWNSFPPYTNKFTFIECANPGFLNKHPHLFWGFYGARLQLYRDTKPHHGHHLLKAIAESKKDFFGVTSNVDGHLGQFFGSKVYEVHGTIHTNQCTKCDRLRDNHSFLPLVDMASMSCQNLPRCPKCDGVERPNILMFGDSGWNSMRSDEQGQLLEGFLTKSRYGKTVIIEIGAGETIPTIRNISRQLLNNQSKLVRINPQEKEEINKNTIVLSGKALDTLQQISQSL